MSTLNQLNLLCRCGFEKECAGEIMALATQQQHPGYVQTVDDSGIVRVISTSTRDAMSVLYDQLAFEQLIFTRQWLLSAQQDLILPESDRVTTIVDHLHELLTNNEQILQNEDTGFCDIEFDYVDTNEGKSLNKFCRQFSPHLTRALERQKLLHKQSPWRLHLLFHDSLRVTIGVSRTDNSASVPMGIPRLKMPSGAPSRSTLKLDEAILWFLSPSQQRKLFSGKRTAVDLGAAPGGWSWQLVQRGCRVIAIDNGPMQDELMNNGMVEHIRTDAFTYQPPFTVDWLVCDMAERPLHVSRLIARWFTSDYCRHAIFNLKLPMKKRYQSVMECLQLLREEMDQAHIDASIRAKQLYHDREEVTVCILRNE